MNIHELTYIANEIFWTFEENHPEARKGEYLSAKTNLILAFDEYVDNRNIQELAAEIGLKINYKDSKRLLKLINKGVEKYLENNIKIIAIN